MHTLVSSGHPAHHANGEMLAQDSAIVGRDEELGAFAAILEAPEALPAALVLEGEAGIGKTTLWRAGVERARALGFRTLSCRAAGTEAELSFAALADLLEPVV